MHSLWRPRRDKLSTRGWVGFGGDTPVIDPRTGTIVALMVTSMIWVCLPRVQVEGAPVAHRDVPGRATSCRVHSCEHR
jgi:hypothetical protein